MLSLVQPRCVLLSNHVMKSLYAAGLALCLLGDSTVILTPAKLQPNSSDLGTSLAHCFPTYTKCFSHSHPFFPPLQYNNADPPIFLPFPNLLGSGMSNICTFMLKQILSHMGKPDHTPSSNLPEDETGSPF